MKELLRSRGLLAAMAVTGIALDASATVIT